MGGFTLRLEALERLSDTTVKALEVEASVFGSAFGESARYLESLYGLYRRQTTMILLLDTNTEPIGSLRLIMPGQYRLRTLEDAARAPFNVDVDTLLSVQSVALSSVAELATLSVVPAHRGGRSSARLLCSAALTCSERDITHLVAMLDTRVGEHFERNGIYFDRLGATESYSYHGSDQTIPAYARVDQLLISLGTRWPELEDEVRSAI